MIKSKKEKRRLFLIMLLFLSVLGYIFFTSYKDLKVIYINRQKITSLKKEYEQLLEDEKKLSGELIKMNDPEYVARYAKEKYMFSAPNETIIRID